MISYEKFVELVKHSLSSPFTVLLKLKKKTQMTPRSFNWTADEKESMRFAANEMFCRLRGKSAPSGYDPDFYAEFKIVCAICSEARVLLKKRSLRPMTLSYEQDLDKNIPAPQWMDDFEEVENQIHLEQICEEVQKKSQKLMDALVASSKRANIQFETFGMSRRTFFRLKKIAFDKFLETA